MAELNDELIWKWKIWWDPVPPWVFNQLGDSVQQQVVAISLQAQAQVLNIQAEAMNKIAGTIGKPQG